MDQVVSSEGQLTLEHTLNAYSLYSYIIERT
jgi:hypothetical protein